MIRLHDVPSEKVESLWEKLTLNPIFSAWSSSPGYFYGSDSTYRYYDHSMPVIEVDGTYHQYIVTRSETAVV